MRRDFKIFVYTFIKTYIFLYFCIFIYFDLNVVQLQLGLRAWLHDRRERFARHSDSSQK